MNLIKSLFNENLHLRFSATSETEAVIFERPGRWMQTDDLADLLEDLRRVARKNLPARTLDYGVLGGDKERLSTCVITMVYEKKTGEPIAFNVLSWIPLDLHGEAIELLHLGLVMIDPDARSKGFSWVLYGLTCFMFYLRGGMRPIWISNVTQVPAVFGLVSQNFSDVYPGHSNVKQSFHHLALARQIIGSHSSVFGVGSDAIFNEDSFVIENAYTGGSDNLKKTFEDCAKHRDQEFNLVCDTQLNYERGDDFLQIGQLSLSSARDFAFKKIPRKSILALATSFGFMMAQAFVLPAMHWLDTSRTYKNLRPARRL